VSEALFLIFSDHSPAGTFGVVARKLGWHVEEVRPHLGEALPPLAGVDALLVFGGPQHLYEGEPWIDAVDALLREAVTRELPTFGVCLGAQLLAKACGGTVVRAREDERGWFPVALTEAAGADELFAALPAEFPAFEWHWDTWTEPEGAVELARSARCTQALRLGRRAWGIQFHAEVSMETIRLWAHGKEPHHPEPVALVEESERLFPAWHGLGSTLAARFFALASS
jgi:GMP synthase-like glutamine amidotransferase